MHDEIFRLIQKAIIEHESTNTTFGIWKEPIVKIISAKNKRIETLKNSVSKDHLMPEDILPNAKSIISFFIPFKENIAESNVTGNMASENWAVAYIKTNELIKKINDMIEILLEREKYKVGKIPATHNFNEKSLISNWSHRHIAYIAGIGTFGINNMLITKNGCCGRFGSIITEWAPNEYEQTGEVKEKCLYKINGSCGLCQKNCMINAYANGKFNRHKCYEQCLKNAKYYQSMGKADVCGKCLVGLPCSTQAP